MNGQRRGPYPAGTRVVQVWAEHVQHIGGTGTCTGETLPAGMLVIARPTGCEAFLPDDAQMVEWDDGSRDAALIRQLRPIEDPDAEPVTTEQDEEITA